MEIIQYNNQIIIRKDRVTGTSITEWKETTGSTAPTVKGYSAVFTCGFLTEAKYSGGDTGSDYSETFSYNDRGGLLTLKRMGVTDLLPSGAKSYGVLDNISGSYTGNRLTSVSASSGAQVYDRRTGMRKSGTYSLGYDASGRLTSDGTRGVTSVTYDDNGMQTGIRTSNIMMAVTRDGLGRKTGMAMNKFNSTGGLMSSDNRSYTGNGHVVSKNASGEPWLEPEYGSGAAGNRYLFGGKERMAGGALNEYDFEARNYVASFQRFTTIDPEAEKFSWLSPYAYCNANPINFIDPTGAHTQVTLKSPGVYQVVGGELDDDLNVYLYCENENGELVNTGISIGETTSATSFYYSEENRWATESIIDLNDESGIDFLDMIMNDTPSLPEYMDKARNFHKYDFKTTNGTDHVISDKSRYKYRGMQIGTIDDKPLITSARDIGNIAAGFVAGANGLSWVIARLGFDGYQTISNGKINFEGISTVNAERYGWKIGFYGTSPIRKIINYEKSRSYLFYKSVSLGIKFSINQILH